MPRPHKDFACIHFLRVVAAFWVLAAHCMIWGGWYGLPLPSAKVAVDLFMLISGFLMVATVRAESMSGWGDAGLFWSRRLLRIAPAYYLSLGLAALSAPWFLAGYAAWQEMNPGAWTAGSIYDPARSDYSIQNLLWHVTFAFGLHPTRSFSTFLPDWSLSLEMQFYVVFPLLLIAARRFGMLPVSLVAVLIASLLNLVVPEGYGEPSLLSFKLQYFVAGMLLYQALGDMRWRYLAGGLLLVSLEDERNSSSIVRPLIFISMYALVRMELAGKNPRAVNLMRRVFRGPADLSYSVYLFHGFWISACGLAVASAPELRELSPMWRMLATFVVVLTGTCATAYVVHRCIERPFIRAGSRWASRERREVLYVDPLVLAKPG